MFSESDRNLEFSIIDEKGNVVNNGDSMLTKGFNTISILPIVNVEISDKKLKKLSFSTNKASDGNIYIGKGKYTFKASSFQESFLVK